MKRSVFCYSACLVHGIFHQSYDAYLSTCLKSNASAVDGGS